MALTFEWDAAKALGNTRKHGVTFEEASTVFGDPLSLTIPDPVHTRRSEQRLLTLGLSIARRLLVVVHLEYGETLRIISARPATSRERKDHEEGR